jgi:hypothetical protein
LLPRVDKVPGLREPRASQDRSTSTFKREKLEKILVEIEFIVLSVVARVEAR